ncbi:transcriptional regulator, TetR family [Polaromonas sp. YR568]|uniref:TetR/AcrR family transcriptional regulator n=1 Tax=Polaromonas sp. YR568 TaxID=1855301 RepID=UPI0008E30682|nr:TetR/AcrR family transcriptional regulator [Polaromonas sp. YR568]SFU70626.1 transcriptional regulator, TetR family [Polaromonas sp. YR568]
MSSAPQSPPPRSTYRHGDLRRALLEAGVELARAGGPEAVVLREATRRAGVAPNAAYRHFDSRQALLYSVRSAALAAVARAMEAELATVPADLPPAEFARANVRAVGAGYLRFAQAESGLFRTAFGPSDDLKERAEGRPADSERKGQSGLDPFELLSAALDKLAAAGVLPPERRPGAEFLAWSAVHGLAMLVIDGPLGPVLGPQMQQIGQRLLDMVEKGL